MRFALCALVFAGLGGVVGCPAQGDDGYGTYYPPGDNGPTGHGCSTDGDCGGQVCARDGECLDASEVRHISVTWTVAGAAASDSACAGEASLDIQFSNSSESNDGVGFAPVPCNEGKFNVDKMPARFDGVSLGAEGSTLQSTVFDGSGDASFDLPSS